MDVISVSGAYDLHVHSAPCIFPRLADDLTVAEASQRAGLCGMVLKSHHEPTVERAAAVNTTLARQGEMSFRALGSITLNYAVGGVNPAVVEVALTAGARLVWMPTIDSLGHWRAFGHIGRWDAQGAGVETHPAEPISICADGRLRDDAKNVLMLCHEYGVALATGHLGSEEIFALAQFAHEQRFERLIVTHPNFRVPGLDLASLRDLAALGAHFEFTYCTVSPIWRHATVDEMVAAIETVGVERAYLSSDGGQLHNPMPHEGLRLLAQMCHEKGISVPDVRRMIVDNPAQLVQP